MYLLPRLTDQNSGPVEFVFSLEYYGQEKAIEDFSYLPLPFHSQKSTLSLHWQVLLAQYGEMGQSSVYIQG